MSIEELKRKTRLHEELIEVLQLENERLLTANEDLIVTTEILIDHEEEAYPHFESERGKKDIAQAREAIKKAKGEI